MADTRVPLTSGLPKPRRTDPDGFSHTMTAYRIDDLGAVREYIMGMDFTDLKQNMQKRSDGLLWSTVKCEWAERCYKRWLFLRRKYEDEPLPPSGEIDEFWHQHMLDTRAYFEDTARIFGYYHHHFPYFGGRSAEDREDFHRAWRNTCERYEEEYGEPILEHVD